MQWKPQNDQIYVSHCGKYIYFLISSSTANASNNYPAKWVVVLDSVTLEEVQIYDLPTYAGNANYSKEFFVK